MTEQVHIARTSSNRSSYHTRECSHFPEKPKAVSREQAERRGLEACTYCEHSFTPANRGGPSEAYRAATERGESEINPPELEHD